MASLAHYRIFGYAVTLMMHGINSSFMLYSLMDKRLMKDPKLQELESMTFNFFTIWNILVQIIYACLGLTWDVLTLMKRDHLLPKPVKKLKDTFFEGIVAPGTMTIVAMFWPFFFWDREFLFPLYIDKVFSLNSNIVMHLGILYLVLWEIAFQPRLEPKSHRKHLVILTTYWVAYVVRVNYVFFQRSLYPYPLMHILHGTMLFYILHLGFLFVTYGSYFLQWRLVSLFWDKESTRKKFK